MELTQEARVGLIIGCTIGGFILFLLFTFVFCLLCRPRNKKKKPPRNASHYDSTYYAGGKPPSDVVPPGVWTSSPSMFAGQPASAYVYANGVPVANGYEKQGPFASEPNLHDQSWYHRTLRRAKSLLKQLPTVFEVHQRGKLGARPNSQRLQAEDSKTVQVNDMTVTEKSHRIQPQTMPELEDTFARAYSTMPAQMPTEHRDSATSPHIAKVYSDYQLPTTAAAAAGDYDEDGLPSTANTRYVEHARISSNGSGPLSSVPPNGPLMTQSDWLLHRPSRAVGRSHSNVEKVHGAEVATNAFRFLEDFDEAISFGDEVEDASMPSRNQQRQSAHY